MSQQSEFHYAEQSNREGRTSNTDPREQSYQPDELAAQQMGGQKIYPQRRNPRRRWLWAVIIIVVILALLGSGSYFSNSAFSKTSTLPAQSFNVSGTPTLIVNDATGSVKFHQGSGNSVVINVTEHGGLFSNLSTDTVKATQDTAANSITIAVAEGGSIFNHGSVDLDITLPATSNIQATVNAGALDINGISGQMNIKLDAGALHFANGTLEGQSTFKTDAGAITFDGSLAANGTYDFEDNAGAINLTLPADSSFTLDASTNVGKVRNDFGSNTVGSNPTSQVHAHTDAGAVTIHER